MTGTMFACWSDAASWISRSNRSADIAAASSGREHLHHDLPAEPALAGDEDAGHPAAAQLALDRVRAAQRVLDALPKVHVHQRR